jgi:Fe-S cluster assembly iron-binding protein IscA
VGILQQVASEADVDGSEIMMRVSDRAIAALNEVLEQSDHENDQVFRLVLQENELGLQLASPQEGDVVYSNSGTPVLAAAPEIADRLTDRTLDIEESAEGPHFVLADQPPSVDPSNDGPATPTM